LDAFVAEVWAGSKTPLSPRPSQTPFGVLSVRRSLFAGRGAMRSEITNALWFISCLGAPTLIGVGVGERARTNQKD